MNRLLPEIRCSKSEFDSTKGVFVYHPLAPGYGITLGNSLRRVLLSSIPSCGIYGVFIPGVSHQYSVIQGVKEDMIQVIHNLKSLNFSFASEAVDEHMVQISVNGPAVITSSDIKVDEVVDVLNKDVYICTVVDEIKFDCSIYIKQDSGYVGLGSSELDVESKFVNFIPVNSISNGVKRVSFDVTNVGYAAHTDYEKLTIELHTDGNISPISALNKASSLLMNGFSSIEMHCRNIITRSTDQQIGNNSYDIVSHNNVERDKKDTVLSSSIRSIEIPMKICTLLEESGICFVGDLISKTRDELMFIPKLGTRKVDEIHKRLVSNGLDFKQS